MRLDIQPHEIRQNPILSFVMETYGYPCMYRFECVNGFQYSVDFDPERLEGFLPSKTASEFIKSGEKALERQYKFWKKGIDTKCHPRYKRAVHNENGEIIGYEPIELRDGDIEYHWKPIAKREFEKVGPIKLIKFVP